MDSETYDPTLNVERSGYSATGFADCYDSYRPKPPDALLDVLVQLARTECPNLVVDLGSGTGLSSFVWAGRAAQVIGIEPNEAMRRQAEAHDYMPNVRFQDGFSHRTGLPDESADIVTCSQSLHWMEPESTFAEVTRILRPGGVFAAYDYDWPPTMDWEAERAFEEFMNRIDEIWRELGIKGEMKRWRKEEHLGRMERSGRFRYVKEFFIHSAETGTADRLIGLVLSQAYVSRVLALGLSEDQIGLEELRQVAKRTLGNEGKAWYFSYRVRIGVK